MRPAPSHPELPRPKIMLLRHTFMSDSTTPRSSRRRKDLSVYYCYFVAWFKNERPIRQGLIEPPQRSGDGGDAELSRPTSCGSNTGRSAEPDEVIARLKGYEALGYDEYLVLDRHAA